MMKDVESAKVDKRNTICTGLLCTYLLHSNTQVKFLLKHGRKKFFCENENKASPFPSWKAPICVDKKIYS